MKHLSAQYVFTNTGLPLKRGIVSASDDGTIVSVENTGGNLTEKESVEFHNGIIIPGFVNCHCHLELSHMKGLIPQGGGLAEFIRSVRSSREIRSEIIPFSASSAENEMLGEGIVLCADICNTRLTFDLKKRSRIRYINQLELFGIDGEKANHRLDEIIQVEQIARDYGLVSWIVPHSVYSLSLPLFRLLRLATAFNRVTSVHFLETEAERTLLKDHEGPILRYYKESGLLKGELQTVSDHVTAVLDEITPAGNLILVHNTYVDREIIKAVRKRGMLYWCLCPNSNLYIENHLPPVDLLVKEECEIVIGTDSLASNNRLSILEELKTLQKAYPVVSLEDLIIWATLNGAEALGEEEHFGTIEPGKKPGLLLLQDVDLVNMKLLPGSSVKRLI
jgi:cytosine/adenosine deaminase-related metal-dependent hydrolase